MSDSPAAAAPRTLVTLDRGECLTLLGSVPIGQVVFTYRALPEILPVNFRVDGESVVLRVAARSRIARLAEGTVLAFHADRVDEATKSGWSVTVVGRVRPVTDEAERDRIAALPLESWMSDERDQFLRIDAERVSGRWLGRP